ncbi:MAG TPA: hypothetical protein VKS01_00510, partial [Bryobacteraceae bacterium]|nr:hypothetical protein [Bryobacteraceae bacterium]
MSEQFQSLVRHFFGRFFDNEFVAQNSEMYATVTKILALLAAPGIVLPCLRMTTYLKLDGLPWAAWQPTLWFDRSFFICFSMLVMGGVTVLEWDALFPDRRDYVSLIPLPIRSRTMFLAKVAALFVFLLAFTVAVNFVSVVLFPLVSYRGDSLHLLWAIAAQAITIFCANAFVFLLLIALEGVLLNVLSVAWFRRASVYVQCGMVFALLSLFFLFPNIGDRIWELRTAHPATLFAFPPMWFLGLNEWMLRTPDATMLRLAAWARWGLLTVAGMGGISYAIAYRRHVRKTLESLEGGEGARTRMHDWVGRVADRIVRNPVERASVAFIGKTIARSAKHRIFLPVYIGAGFALVAQGIAASGGKQAWLSAPLVLSFFSLSGLRYIYTVPVELPANWLFRVTENHERRRALDGARRAMQWFGIAPLFVALAPFYFAMWTPWVAAAHWLFSVTISMLLVEAMLIEFWKIPFTCSYPPGKANVTVLWVVYWAAFTTYAYSMAALEGWMVKRPARLIVFYIAAAMAWKGFEMYRRRWDAVGFSLMFDDAPEPTVRTLGLSEIAWLSTPIRNYGDVF